MSSNKRRKEVRKIRNPEINLSDSESRIRKEAKELHLILFSEEYDFILDSRIDIDDRRKGINPMSKEYQNKIRLKRQYLGVSQLDESGMPGDNSSMELCLNEARAKFEGITTNKTTLINEILVKIKNEKNA